MNMIIMDMNMTLWPGMDSLSLSNVPELEGKQAVQKTTLYIRIMELQIA